MNGNMPKTNSKWKDTFKRRKNVKSEVAKKVIERRKTAYFDQGDTLLSKYVYLESLGLKCHRAQDDDAVDGKADKKRTSDDPLIDKDDLRLAREIAILTACRADDVQDGVKRADMIKFAKKVFHLSYDEIEKAEQQVQQWKPKLQLSCKVMKASELKPKNPHDTRDINPYCRLAIVDKSYRPDHEFKSLYEYHKLGATTKVASTCSASSTSNPVWNKDIILPVQDITKDVLIVQVWNNSQANSGSPKKKSSVKSLKSPDKKDFIGWLFHPLLLIPITGSEMKIMLMSRSKKPNKGFLSLFMTVQSVPDKPLEISAQYHSLLVRALMDKYSISADGQYQCCWDGELTSNHESTSDEEPANLEDSLTTATVSSDSERLLELHGSQNGLDQLQQVTIRLTEMLRYHRKYDIDMQAFLKLIKIIKKLQMFLPQSADEASSCSESSGSLSPASVASPTVSVSFKYVGGTAQTLVEQMFSDLLSLEGLVMTVMQDHIRLAVFSYGGKVDKIESHLRVLYELHSFHALVERMDSDKSDLRHKLEKCIEPAVDTWYARLKRKAIRYAEEEEEELKLLCSDCSDWTEIALKKLQPIFIEAGVDYLSHFFIALDRKLSVEVKEKLVKYKDGDKAYTFEMYTVFRGLFKLSEENVPESIRQYFLFQKFHKWFERFVPQWISLAAKKCESRTLHAIELDEIVKITDELNMSSSAVDTNGFILQMNSFWQHLDWPDPSVAFGYTMAVLQNMCNVAALYVDKVYQPLAISDVCDDKGTCRFKASEKLCLMLNNMQYVREFISQELPTHMELEKFFSQLQGEHVKQRSQSTDTDPLCDDDEMTAGVSTETLGDVAEKKISDLLKTADEDIYNKIDQTSLKIAERLYPSIEQLISAMLTSGEDDMEKLIEPLFNYLSENLSTLAFNLFATILESITLHLWEISVKAIKKFSDMPRRKGETGGHKKLHNTLLALRNFYYCDGSGLIGRTLDNETYLLLRFTLETLQMTTEELITHFYEELVGRQIEECEEFEEEELGQRQVKQNRSILTLSIGYVVEKEAIEVNVVQGQNIETVEEAYIKLRLSSTIKSTQKHYKTKTIKGKQASPLFNEEFTIPLTEQEMKAKDSVLLFYLYDRKLKPKKHYVGLCVVACKSIPRISESASLSLTDPSAPQRKNLRLPLFSISEETPIITELNARAEFEDTKALNFFKAESMLFSHLQGLYANKLAAKIRRTPHSDSVH